jgi:hypothetical protein
MDPQKKLALEARSKLFGSWQKGTDADLSSKKVAIQQRTCMTSPLERLLAIAITSTQLLND